MTAALRSAGVALAGLMLASPAWAQGNVPSTWAITNARLVPVSSAPIDKGTIVIRNGLISAMGAGLQPPADARVIDGTGLTVYPGLIDSYTSLGFPTPAAQGGAAGGGRGAAAAPSTADVAPNSNYESGLQPEVMAVDQLDPDATAFDAAHAAGFTTAITASAGGIYRGQSALINLRAGSVNELVVKSPVAQHLGFSRGGGRGFGGGGGYPGSLMGSIAALRQELYDAMHYRDLKAAYDRDPRGLQRPEHDPSLEALQPVLAGTQPVVVQANSDDEIRRVLHLMKEFNLKVIIAGGAESYKVSDELKAAGVPVLLSTDFPERGSGGGGGRGFGRGGGGGADQPEPLDALRARVEQPKGPGMLDKAGVRFVFESNSNFTGFLANLRKAVNAGLPADDALKALTSGPADLFGVSNRLGTLDVGKIANLTVTNGDLFDSATRVTQLFVDGQPIDIPAPAPAAGNGGRGNRGGGGNPGGLN